MEDNPQSRQPETSQNEDNVRQVWEVAWLLSSSDYKQPKKKSTVVATPSAVRI
jgi:hypothetical protein